MSDQKSGKNKDPSEPLFHDAVTGEPIFEEDLDDYYWQRDMADDYYDDDHQNVPSASNSTSGKKRTKAKKTEASSNPEQRASLATDILLADVIYNPALEPPIQFAVSQTGKAKTQPEVKTGNQIYVPPKDSNGLLEKGVVLVASSLAPYGTQKELVDSLVACIHRYCDVPPFWEQLIAHYILVTWVYDRFTAIAYLRFLGEASTGKSRNGQVAGTLCYKAIMASGAITASPLFRLMDIYHGTFFVDEADFRNSAEWTEIIKVLNCGYMKGIPILRSSKAGDDYEPRAYDAFGPKIIANRVRFDDYALESRCITLQTEEKSVREDIPRQLPPRFFDEAKELRNKLLQWRFDRYHQIEADESKLLHLEPRLTQIGTPIHAVSEDEEFRAEFVKFLEESSAAEREQRPQAIVVESIKRARDSWSKANELTISVVAEHTGHVSEGIGDGNAMSPKKVGGIVRSLGFKTYRCRDGYRFRVTPERLDELLAKYGVV